MTARVEGQPAKVPKLMAETCATVNRRRARPRPRPRSSGEFKDEDEDDPPAPEL
jgi:hypothetical protein